MPLSIVLSRCESGPALLTGPRRLSVQPDREPGGGGPPESQGGSSGKQERVILLTIIIRVGSYLLTCFWPSPPSRGTSRPPGQGSRAWTGLGTTTFLKPFLVYSFTGSSR